MDPADSHALVFPAVNENQDDSLANQEKLSSTPSIDERELYDNGGASPQPANSTSITKALLPPSTTQLQQLPQETPLMITNTNTLDGAIAAVPLSYKLADDTNISTLKEKNESLSETWKSTPKSRKRKQPQEDQYNKDIWECEEKPRKNSSVVDKYYRHKTKNFKCRSLKEIERYETTGIRPSAYRGKAIKKESTGEAVKKMGDGKAEKILFAKNRRKAEKTRIEVEKFLAEARYNLYHAFDHLQLHTEDDPERTPSPSPSPSAI